MQPLVITPNAGGSPKDCGKALRAVLDEGESLAHAPRLFRGFGLEGPADLAELLAAAGLAPSSYIGGNSPRTQLGDNVYTSTEHSAVADITLHQELSYEQCVPDLCFFLCGTPATTGGATPLSDAAALLEALDSEVVEAFETRGLRYVQRLPRSGGLGKSWPDTFETEDPAACERLLQSRDLDFEWETNDVLVLVRHRTATRPHSRTGRSLWFNQADQWHPSVAGTERARQALRRIYGDRLPHDVTFGDRTPIPDDWIRHISRTSREIAWAQPWQAGDLVVIDNQATMHGRDRYTGTRAVYVAMANLDG